MGKPGRPRRDWEGEKAAAQKALSEVFEYDEEREWTTEEKTALIRLGILTFKQLVEDL